MLHFSTLHDVKFLHAKSGTPCVPSSVRPKSTVHVPRVPHNFSNPSTIGWPHNSDLETIAQRYKKGCHSFRLSIPPWKILADWWSWGDVKALLLSVISCLLLCTVSPPTHWLHTTHLSYPTVSAGTAQPGSLQCCNQVLARAGSHLEVWLGKGLLLISHVVSGILALVTERLRLAVDQKLLSAPCHMATIGQLSSSKPTKDRAHSAGQTSQGEPTEFTCVLFTVPVTLIVYIWAEAYTGPTRAPGKAPHKGLTQRGMGLPLSVPPQFPGIHPCSVEHLEHMGLILSTISYDGIEPLPNLQITKGREKIHIVL